jgi:starvation-inducible DNA-binding protein
MGWTLASLNNARLQVPIQPNLGLDGDARRSIMEILNTILADEAVMALKTHRARWHVHGVGFLELRELFKEQYHQLDQISEEIGERVSMLGGPVVSSFTEYLKYTRLDEEPVEAGCIMSLLADQEAFIRFLREDVRKCQDEYDDQGTTSLLVRVISSHEKMAWILRSYIEPG